MTLNSLEEAREESKKTGFEIYVHIKNFESVFVVKPNGHVQQLAMRPYAQCVKQTDERLKQRNIA